MTMTSRRMSRNAHSGAAVNHTICVIALTVNSSTVEPAGACPAEAAARRR